MSIEILTLIASLCLTPNGGDSWQVFDFIHGRQLQCQQYYVKCVKAKKGLIEDCILEKKAGS